MTSVRAPGEAPNTAENGQGELPERELAARVAALEAVQATQTARSKPWYRQASVLIAALALLFSISATWFGEQRAGERDEAAARAELAQLIQRLTSLPKDNAELQMKYAGDPMTLNTLSGMVTTENTVLAQQASDVITRIPDHVGGAEYFAVGQALVLTGDYARAKTVLDAGLARDNDVSSEAALWRAKGGLYFSTGELEAARGSMSKALEAYTAEQPNVAAAANVFTEWVWAGSEKTLGECDAAEAHLQRAHGHLERLPMTPFKVQMLQSLSAVQTNATDACPAR
jgi:tetratricopeptide (TPR) repeat protein